MTTRFTALAAAILIGGAGPALAGPTLLFAGSTSAALPSDLGTVTLTQITANSVEVHVDLFDTSIPLPAYGFVNTGGPHTPFAFTIGGTEKGVSASFSQPLNGSYLGGIGGTTGPFTFSLTTANSSDTPYGTFGVGILSTADNGSNDAYFGDLDFTVTRTSGLSTTDFISNASIDDDNRSPAYFAADLTDGKTTGSVAWRKDPTVVPTATPEPASMVVLGSALAGLGFIRRRNASAV